jgi:hypothetical protein
MSSNLTVVYQRLVDQPIHTQPPEENPQTSVIVNSVEEESSSHTSISWSQSQSEGGSDRRSTKDSDKKQFMKLCTGVGITLSIVGVIWFFASLIVTLKVYRDVKECVHPSLFEMKETVFNENNVHRIDFNVISGYVNIGFHDKPHITIRHFDRFKRGHVFDAKTAHSAVSIHNGLISILSENSAFDLNSCQHSSVDVLIPKSYSRAISFTGVVKTGAVFIEGDRTIPVGAIDIIVEAGYIKADHLNALALSLSSEVGIIKVKDTLSASGVKLNVQTGSIKSKHIVAKTFNANVKYGLSSHKDLTADSVNVETNMGYSSVKDVSSFEKLQNITVKTVYGKSLLLLGNPHVNFQMSNKKGNLLIDYKQNEYRCNVFLNKTVNVLGGKCNTFSEKATDNQAYIAIDTTYGNSEITMDRE